MKAYFKGEKTLSWIISLLWAVLILWLFWQSRQETTMVSTHLSKGLLSLLMNFGLSIEGELFHLGLRKAAHSIVFFAGEILLAFSFLLSFKNLSVTKNLLYSGMTYSLFALIAEVVKLGIPGRDFTIDELVLDLLGIWLGALCWKGWFAWKNRKARKNPQVSEKI